MASRRLLRPLLIVRLRIIPTISRRAITFWHWAATWNWFSIAVSGGLGAMVRIGEYAFTVTLLSIAAFGAISKVVHSNKMQDLSILERRSIKTAGILALIVAFGYMVAVATLNSMRENSWSNLPRIIAYAQAIISPTQMVIRVPTPPLPSLPSVTVKRSRPDASAAYIRPYFKNSPVFTSSVKSQIAGELNRFYEYLSRVGFHAPTELPPIASAKGYQGNVGGIYRTPINPKMLTMTIGETAPVTASRIGYSNYSFDLIFKLFEDPHNYNDNRFNFTRLYAEYYSASFGGKLSPQELIWKKDWLTVLWKVRMQYGARYLDECMFQAASFLDDPDFATNVPFDMFFYLRFRYGEQVVENDWAKLNLVDDILIKDGLKIRNGK